MTATIKEVDALITNASFLEKTLIVILTNTAHQDFVNVENVSTLVKMIMTALMKISV